MRRLRAWILPMLLGLAMTQQACAQAPKRAIVVNTGDLTVKSVRDLPSPVGVLVAGTGVHAAEPQMWQSSFYSTAGFFRCSATLIGPKTVLTAAHCVGNGRQITIERMGYPSKTGTCKWAEAYYLKSTSYDYALCLMNGAIDADFYETVISDPAKLNVQQDVMITGFGCISAGMGFQNKMHWGPSHITDLPGYQPSLPGEMRLQGKTAVVCDGDSGGGTYVGTQGGQRGLIAINAASDNMSISYLAPLSTDVGIALLKDWAGLSGNPKKDDICGMTKMMSKCKPSPL